MSSWEDTHVGVLCLIKVTKEHIIPQVPPLAPLCHSKDQDMLLSVVFRSKFCIYITAPIPVLVYLFF